MDGKAILITAALGLLLTGGGAVVRGGKKVVSKIAHGTKTAAVKVVNHQK